MQPIALFSKNGGTGEVGLGLNGLVDDEISGLNFLQISVDTIRASLTNFKFSMDSVDNSEGWVVYGSMDATPFTFVQLAHSSGTLDNGVHSLADGFDNYNFLFAPSGAGGPTGNSDVLLHSFSADLQAVPIPLRLLVCCGHGRHRLAAACHQAVQQRRTAKCVSSTIYCSPTGANGRAGQCCHRH